MGMVVGDDIPISKIRVCPPCIYFNVRDTPSLEIFGLSKGETSMSTVTWPQGFSGWDCIADAEGVLIKIRVAIHFVDGIKRGFAHVLHSNVCQHESPFLIWCCGWLQPTFMWLRRLTKSLLPRIVPTTASLLLGMMRSFVNSTEIFFSWWPPGLNIIFRFQYTISKTKCFDFFTCQVKKQSGKTTYKCRNYMGSQKIICGKAHGFKLKIMDIYSILIFIDYRGYFITNMRKNFANFGCYNNLIDFIHSLFER